MVVYFHDIYRGRVGIVYCGEGIGDVRYWPFVVKDDCWGLGKSGICGGFVWG